MLCEEKVVENKLIGHPALHLYKLVLNGQIAQTAEPGQFVHVKVGQTHDPLLRRPISIAGIDRKRGEITLYYRVAGRGTDLLTRLKENETLSILGPLGTGFTIPQKGELLLLAGGIGIFPLFSLIQAVEQTKVKIKLLWGGENRRFFESAGLEELRRIALDYEVSTLDGSLGTEGLITALLQDYLARNSRTLKFACDFQMQDQHILRAAACGPKGMLKAVTSMCLQESIPIEVSLEERMACGVGACLGCVCTVRGESGNVQRKRVCKDGPVFNGGEVIWDEEN